MKYLFIPLENNSSFSLSLPFYETVSFRKYCKIKIEEIYKKYIISNLSLLFRIILRISDT